MRTDHEMTALVDSAEDFETTEALLWPEPDLSLLATRRTDPPDIPLQIFGPWADWLSEQADTAGAPVDYAAMALLTIAGGCIANTRWGSPWPGWREPPIVNVGVVGLPSSGKSPAIDTIFTPLRDAEWRLGDGFDLVHAEWKRQKAEAEASEAAWQKEVAKAVKMGVPAPRVPDGAIVPREPTRPRLYLTDPTMEAAAVLAADEPKGLVLARDELAGWVGSMDKYGGEGSDRAFWIESYGGRPKIIDRVKFKGIPLRVPHLSIAIVGGIQPDRLASMMLGGDDDGMAARFCLIWPEQVPLSRPKSRPSPDRLRDAFLALRGLQMAADEEGDAFPMSVSFTEGAAAALHAFRIRNREREAGTSGLYLSWLGKLPGLVLRIATILEHVWWADAPMPATGPSTITVDAAGAACILIERYLMPMAVRVYGEAALPEVERDAAGLARWIMSQDPIPATVNARSLRHARAISTKEAKRYDAALVELEEVGWVKPAPTRAGDQPGRKAKTWLVSPRLAEKRRSDSKPRSDSSDSPRKVGSDGDLSGPNGAIGPGTPNGTAFWGGGIQL